MTETEIQDAILRSSLNLMRLSAGEQVQVEKALRELETELRALMGQMELSEAGKRQIDDLIAKVNEAIDGKYTTIAGQVDTQQIAIVVAGQTKDVIEQAFLDAASVSETRLASLTKDVMIDGAASSDWWAKQSEDLQFRFAAQVRQGVVNNETQEQIVTRIVGKRGEPGIMETTRRNARALVHSSVMSAANEARLATYRKNKRYIAGIRWLSTLDNHTCKTCGALDHASWDLDGNPLKGTTLQFQLPPAHWGCRCVASPVPDRSVLDRLFPGMTADIDAASQRASKDGQIAGGTTFEQFLSRQSDDFVNATLGKKRADLFRAGKITLRDLVSGNGRELSLEELKAL